MSTWKPVALIFAILVLNATAQLLSGPVHSPLLEDIAISNL